MSRGDDDFYYGKKPHASIASRRHLSLEARGAAQTYEDEMHVRDGTIPDERTANGMRWHLVALGVRDRRTVSRLIGELLEHGELQRLGDGRLTMKEVQRERAYQERRRNRRGGGGGGGQSGGGEPRQLTLIEGGRSPQRPVDEVVDEVGTDDEMAPSRASKSHLPTISGRKTQQNQRPASPTTLHKTHEVVAVWTRFRARDPPLGWRA